MADKSIYDAQILIVDDVKENVDILNGLLSDFKRKVAMNGKKALEIARNQPTDLILLDVMMPEMDGYTACEELRKDEKTRDIPVIFLTAKSDKKDIIRGFDVGGQDYVTKPFDPTELMARVKTQLELKLGKAALTEALVQLKETQGQLVHNEKMVSLGVLTAGISHEINNPINFVDAGIQSLQMDLKDYEPVRNVLFDIIDGKEADMEKLRSVLIESNFKEIAKDFFEIADSIEEGARRTKEIVRGLKNFSRHDEAEQKLADINEGLESTLLLLQNEYKNRIEIIKDYGELPEVLCYPGQLNQVFMNLLANAIQAIDEEGTISITTEVIDDMIEVRIEDTGKGIPEDVQSRIFEPFFTTKEVGAGTGLGLSITYGIVEKHGGSIEMESKEGDGTIFKVRIPAAR